MEGRHRDLALMRARENLAVPLVTQPQPRSRLDISENLADKLRALLREPPVTASGRSLLKRLNTDAPHHSDRHTQSGMRNQLRRRHTAITPSTGGPDRPASRPPATSQRPNAAYPADRRPDGQPAATAPTRPPTPLSGLDGLDKVSPDRVPAAMHGSPHYLQRRASRYDRADNPHKWRVFGLMTRRFRPSQFTPSTSAGA